MFIKRLQLLPKDKDVMFWSLWDRESWCRDGIGVEHFDTRLEVKYMFYTCIYQSFLSLTQPSDIHTP